LTSKDYIQRDSGIEHLFQHLRVTSTEKALDVATGEGVFIRSLMKTLKQYHSFIGTDISQKHINKASRVFKKNVAQFVKMNAETLEFNDSSFDMVSMSESLHHIKDPRQVLKEIGRVLTPEGVFILQESFSDEDQKKSQLSDVLIHEFIAENDVLRGYYLCIVLSHAGTEWSSIQNAIFDALICLSETCNFIILSFLKSAHGKSTLKEKNRLCHSLLKLSAF
jgi:ubiquinone/menaquinone biosynthesis C-methylase UbiE